MQVLWLKPVKSRCTIAEQANLKNIFVSPYQTLFYRYGRVGRKNIFFTSQIGYPLNLIVYSKTCLKRPLNKSQEPGLPLGGRTPYITSKNRLRTPKLHIKDVPRTSENYLVRPKMDIETSCLQKKPAHIYQIT